MCNSALGLQMHLRLNYLSRRVEMDNRPRAVSSFRRNPSHESKNRRKQNKKKKKIVGTHQAKLAPEARRTKTFSTRILQESFACGSCFTHVP